LLLGHAQVRHTVIYLHLSPTARRLLQDLARRLEDRYPSAVRERPRRT